MGRLDVDSEPVFFFGEGGPSHHEVLHPSMRRDFCSCDRCMFVGTSFVQNDSLLTWILKEMHT